MTTRADMLFITEMSARYHRRRASFLEVASSLMSLVTVIGGAGAFLTLIGSTDTTIAKFATLALTLVGTVQLVFKIDTAAALHKQWLKQWTRILLEIRTNSEPNVDVIARWIEERYSIEVECVVEMRALQADCFNRTMKALYRVGDQYRLRWWHRAFMQVWPFEAGVA